MIIKSYGPGLGVAVLGAMIGGAALTVAAWLASHVWVGALGAGMIWLAAVLTSVIYIQRRALFFVQPLTSEAAEGRIRGAYKEIWSLQISGSEFTAQSIDSYSRWLRADPDRKLRLAFANPTNTGLLSSIVKLSGLGRISNDGEATEHLRQIILASLEKYSHLSAELAGQIDLRVYDCSPPFSIHAVDPTSPYQKCSLFIELYLPDLASRERPCILMRKNHVRFTLYVNKARAWFDQACPCLDE
jgi:hypothetical protein